MILLLWIDETPNLNIFDTGQIQSVNITWSLHQLFAYIIVVTNSTSSLLLNSTDLNHLLFTAPDNAPPCEVYNFSFNATPVGATYTGDGCSLPSPMVSRMLSSLPDADKLNNLLKYSLEKTTNESAWVNLKVLTVS